MSQIPHPRPATLSFSNQAHDTGQYGLIAGFVNSYAQRTISIDRTGNHTLTCLPG